MRRVWNDGRDYRKAFEHYREACKLSSDLSLKDGMRRTNAKGDLNEMFESAPTEESFDDDF